ncbi:MAG: hypothetical protein AAB974_03935 [Patescibacteria group bacterium]
MSDKQTLTLTVQDETTIAKLLGFKSLRGYAVEARVESGRHVVTVRDAEKQGPKAQRFEVRLVRDGAGAEFRQAPTNQNVRSLRDLIEQRGLAEIDIETFAKLRQHQSIPLDADAWKDGLRRAVVHLRDMCMERVRPINRQIQELEAFLTPPKAEAKPTNGASAPIAAE